MHIVTDIESTEAPPITPSAGVPPSIPAERTLDPGEAIVSPDAVEFMASIVKLGDSLSETSVDASTTTLIVYAILIYFGFKIAMRLMPIIFTVGAIVIFMKMFNGTL
jgi:hypothetical protein